MPRLMQFKGDSQLLGPIGRRDHGEMWPSSLVPAASLLLPGKGGFMQVKDWRASPRSGFTAPGPELTLVSGASPSPSQASRSFPAFSLRPVWWPVTLLIGTSGCCGGEFRVQGWTALSHKGIARVMGIYLRIHQPATACISSPPFCDSGPGLQEDGGGLGGRKSILLKKANWRLWTSWCKHFSSLWFYKIGTNR